MKTPAAPRMGTWIMAAAWLVGGSAPLADAQTVAPANPVPPPAVSRPPADRQQRYRIATMERVLEGAVEHGASVTRERLKAFLPADMLLNENARVRGFRLEGYGVFFDVAVPSLEGTLPWSFRVLNQNNLGVDSAVRTLQSFIETSANNPDVEQAFRRLVMQVAPMSPGLATRASAGPGTPVTDASASPTASPQLAPPLPGAAGALGASAGVGPPTGPGGPTELATPVGAGDPIMTNPQEAYRSEVRDALMDAMLDHSRSLNLAADEWLTIAARSNDDRPRVAPLDSDTQTVLIRVRGADLNAYLAGQMSREDARQRMDVRVF